MIDAPIFRRWLASGDPVLVAHARHRLEGREAPASPPGPGVAHAIELTRRMGACPFRSRDASCGCSGGRCALRRGAVVSHLDCFGCLERYP